MALFAVAVVLLFSSCYGKGESVPKSLPMQAEDSGIVKQVGGKRFAYNYNFVVKGDSVPLVRQQPEEILSLSQSDTFHIYGGELAAVADVKIMPADTVDSVWVLLATDMAEFGWTHESELLPLVVPDDPISRFISFFSETHMIAFAVIMAAILTAYVARLRWRKESRLVHVDDIPSVYPALLAVMVALAATLYATIQNFAPEEWRYFYYHPTLNPFSESMLLSVFLVSVWMIIILSMAAVEDTLRHLPSTDAALYLLGLTGVCAANYVVFSIATLYYVGYALLAAYVVFAAKAYMRSYGGAMLCGACGGTIHSKGKCPHCGALNV